MVGDELFHVPVFDDPAALQAEDVDDRIAVVAPMETLEDMQEDEVAIGEGLANSTVRSRVDRAKEADEFAEALPAVVDVGLCWT